MQSLKAPDTSSYKETKKRLESAGRLRWFHWGIIIASLLLTIVLWYSSKQANQQQVEDNFNREADRAVAMVTERLAKYEDALWGGVAAISSKSQGMTVDEWRDYSRVLNLEEKYPGINGIGVIDFVRRENIQEYIETQRLDRPEFKVFPKHKNDDLWPIVYVEPVEVNAAAIGLDIAHESNRHKAARKARDTGLAQITGPIILVQDNRKTPGFLFYAPHYNGVTPATQLERRETFVNLVYAPFIFDRLMLGTLQMDKRLVVLKVTDEGVPLYDEISSANERGRTDSHRKDITVDLYGRQWRFEIQSNAAFDNIAASDKSWVILVTGLAIEALIILLFTALARANRRAVEFAGDMAQAHEIKANSLNNILDNAIEGIILSDESNGIQSFNKASEDLFGYKAEEIVGQKFGVLFPYMKDDFLNLHKVNAVEATPQILQDFYMGHMREVTGRHKDGSDIMLEMSISEILDRGKPIYNTIVRDITRRKTAETRLKKTMEDLVLSNEDLERFAYSASHDLKSPLRAIFNLSKWLEEDLTGKIDDENLERVNMLQSRASRMEDLLDGLLAYSRAGRKVDEKTIMPAADLMAQIRELLNVPDGFEVIIDTSLENISIPRMPLEQVFHNLISNSIKHHDKDTGLVKISAVSQKDKYVFEIEDDGPGIDPKFQHKIFEMFQTLKSRDEVEGSGMGLALVRKILHHHGGRIRVDARPEGGSVFTVTWPKVANAYLQNEATDRSEIPAA